MRSIEFEISKFIPEYSKLCFYPSSGVDLIWAVMDLDCDFFIFSDKGNRYINWEMVEKDFEKNKKQISIIKYCDDFIVFRSGEKTGFFIWKDNNIVIEWMNRCGLKVHHFIGICDGCCEGGNYECVNDRPFVTKLLKVASNGMKYITDHSESLQKKPDLPPGWIQGAGMWHTRKFLPSVMFEDFSEPLYKRGKASVPETHIATNAHFELQGVLVRPNEAPQSLVVLPKGDKGTQLNVFEPYRAIARRSIIAEYSVLFS